MPEISRFRGIVVKMYHRDHAPPHFHAKYGEHEISVQIWNGLIRGRFPRGALRDLLERYDQRRVELLRNWEHASNDEPFEWIDPLD